jgi:hypothetical protein
MTSSSSANVAPLRGSHPKSGFDCRLSDAMLAPVVATVSVVVTALPFGVTDAGLKLHVTPFGNVALSQLNMTAWLKPFCGVTVNVTLPEDPCFTVSDAGLAETVYDGVNCWNAMVVVAAA